MKYRSKPVIKEAFQWTGDENQTEDPEWIIDAINGGKVWFKNSGTSKVTMMIETLEGSMEASQGDYIIKGLSGEIYPCKSGIFEKSYEKVEE